MEGEKKEKKKKRHPSASVEQMRYALVQIW